MEKNDERSQLKLKKCLGKFNREDDWKISNVREPIMHKIKRTEHEK